LLQTIFGCRQNGGKIGFFGAFLRESKPKKKLFALARQQGKENAKPIPIFRAFPPRGARKPFFQKGTSETPVPAVKFVQFLLVSTRCASQKGLFRGESPGALPHASQTTPSLPHPS
jgi:hypothetical protein